MRIMGLGAPSVSQVEKQLMKLRADLHNERQQLYELRLRDEPHYDTLLSTIEIIYKMAIESLKHVLTLQRDKGSNAKYDNWKQRLNAVIKELANVLKRAGAQDLLDQLETEKRTSLQGLPA
ncbi:MAG: hypothetical protein KKE20_00945 [Nanoarchaeota archaeon]|nr:hypothetical protein [Nanoarchaeota archaeon]